ncbi:hypothetical protein C6496_18815 [Candidatus Poribacteria bacterium]|nr:MAG: hypothetical protein C6496_18815 [Candidatus Poribacteria bacterium]
MKSQITLFLIYIGICLVSVAAAEQQTWTFDDNAADWTPANGTWEVEDGVYKQTTRYGEAQKTLANGAEWTDHTVTAKVRIEAGHWAGIVFRAQNEFEYYVYLICPKENKSELWRHRRSTAFKDGFEGRDEIEHDIAPIGLTLTRNEWFTLSATLEGSRIALAINSIEQAVFFDDTYPRGRVGVWTWDTQASFDDVSVNGVTTTTLTAVEPHGKLATSWAVLKRIADRKPQTANSR